MNNELSPIRVVLVDDHPLVLEAVKSFLEKQRGFVVLGEASDGIEAVKKTLEFLPDVVVMDISMPGMNGIEAARRLREVCPESRVLMLTVHEKREVLAEVMRSGARGCVRKSMAPSDLVAAIEMVHAGGLVFEPELLEELQPPLAPPAGPEMLRVT